MRRFKFLGILLLCVVAFGMTSCATSEKKEEAIEVQPTAEELARQELEEQKRMEQEELEAMREEEAARERVREMEFDASAVMDTVYFDFDKYNLSDSAREGLSKNAEWLKQNPDTVIQIEGHCDERGTDEYNLSLGEKRAASAKAYLVSLGVEQSRIYTISFGEENPVDMGHTEEAWSKNRRAEFKITAK